jgi:hypothetical protein
LVVGIIWLVGWFGLVDWERNERSGEKRKIRKGEGGEVVAKAKARIPEAAETLSWNVELPS